MLHNPESEEISDWLIIFKKRFVLEKFKPIKKQQHMSTMPSKNLILASDVLYFQGLAKELNSNA